MKPQPPMAVRKRPARSNQQRATSHRPAAVRRRSASSNQQRATSHRPGAIRQRSVPSNQQPATSRQLWCAVVVALGVAACGGSKGASDEPARPPSTASVPAPAATSALAAPAAKRDTRPRVVILGDSLTAGLGLPSDQSYPTLLQQRLTEEGLNYEVINAGVSGDTSAGGLSRLDWALDGDVRVLVVALGGNDALRGLPTEALKHNLAEIIERAQARKIRVILAGMEAPPNYGRDYIVSFHKVYPALAQQYGVAFIPFLLQNVAGVERLNQPDGIHPTAAGARIVADNVWAVLKPLVEDHPRS